MMLRNLRLPLISLTSHPPFPYLKACRRGKRNAKMAQLFMIHGILWYEIRGMGYNEHVVIQRSVGFA